MKRKKADDIDTSSSEARCASSKKGKLSDEVEKQAQTHLNKEIVAFTKFVGLTRAETRARHALKKRVHGLVCQLWPNATIKQFGSHETGLEWFESDIDLRVEFSSDPLTATPADEACLMLREVLVSRSWVLDIEARPQARIPIVCFRDKFTDVEVDVSFEDSYQTNDSAGSNYFAETHAHFHDVVVLLKALFKHNRNLDKPFYGGLGSFRLCVLVDHFFKTNTTHADLGTPADSLVSFLRYCTGSFNWRMPILVISADRRQSLSVSYGNINPHVFRHTCISALAVLQDPAQSPDTRRLPLMFPSANWNRLLANRQKKIALAHLTSRSIKTSAIPPPHDLYKAQAACESGEAHATLH